MKRFYVALLLRNSDLVKKVQKRNQVGEARTMADPLIDEVSGAAWNGERAKLASRLSNPQVVKLINLPSSRGNL